jgi:hypothetical protein
MEQCMFYQNSENSAPCFYFSQEMQMWTAALITEERGCVYKNPKLMQQI